LEPADDGVTLADGATVEEPVADAQTGGDLVGDTYTELEPGSVGELAVPVPAAVSELLAAADAALSGSAAAEALLVCWPVELDVEQEGAADLATQESFIDDLTIDAIVEADPNVTCLEALSVSSDSGLEGISGDGVLIASPDELPTGIGLDYLTEAVSAPLPSETPGTPSLYEPGGPGPIELLPPPVITTFSATKVMGDVWYFSGTVQYAVPSSLIVTLGGLLGGQTVSVHPNGVFSYSVMWPYCITGIVSAQASLSGGAVTSNVATDTVIC
jgi:hypothetical protein